MATAYVYTCNTPTGSQIENGWGVAADGRLVPHCPNGGQWITLEYVEDVPGGACCTPEQMALIGITPGDVATTFASAFGIVCVFWGLGWAIGVGKRAIGLA